MFQLQRKKSLGPVGNKSQISQTERADTERKKGGKRKAMVPPTESLLWGGASKTR